VIEIREAQLLGGLCRAVAMEPRYAVVFQSADDDHVELVAAFSCSTDAHEFAGIQGRITSGPGHFVVVDVPGGTLAGCYPARVRKGKRPTPPRRAHA
jgi:hypothetical protein